ncbi:MAG: hypothetical protein RIC35_02545 [Marinoscillum sp.]
MPRKPLITDIDLNRTPKALTKLVEEQKRTDIGARTLVKYGNLPGSLTESRIYNIFSGLVKYPSKQEYEALLNAYAKFPSRNRIPLSAQKINQLKTQIEEKRIPKATIAKSLPRYLNFNVSILNQWLKRNTKTADEQTYKAVLDFINAYEPPRKVSIATSDNSRMTEITPIFLQKLEAEIKRTNVQPHMLLRITRIEGVNAAMINDWRKGKRSKAKAEKLDAVLQAYSKL